MGFAVHVVSHDADFIAAFAAHFQGVPHVSWSVGDVCAVPTQGRAFLSPANSIGFMDGGIDFAYSRVMFPGVERQVMAKIASLGRVTALGRPYLPVGSAIVVPRPREGSALVSAPTMFLPHDVSDTQNARHAFTAALAATENPDIHTLVATGLCCGYGRMPVDAAAAQMRGAYDRFARGERPPQIAGHDDTCAYLTAPCDSDLEHDTREVTVKELYL